MHNGDILSYLFSNFHIRVVSGKGTVTNTLTTALEQADGQTLNVNFTFATVGAPELTNAAGETYYLVGGNKIQHTANTPVGVKSHICLVVTCTISIDIYAESCG